MKRFLVIGLSILFALFAEASLTDDNVLSSEGHEAATAVDLLRNIYHECLYSGSFSCVKPKVLAFLSTSMSKDKIRLTRDLTIVSSGQSQQPAESTSVFNEVPKLPELDEEQKEKLRLLALDKMDEFLYNHELRIRIPKEILSGDLPAYVPKILTKNLPDELRLPLADGGSAGQVTGRSRKFLRRVVMPFLIGLKFKATTLIPLAFALIALKTWKALTLALLSVVLSGAMVIFKFSKPKAHYEVIHYPQPVPVFEPHAHVPHVQHVPHVHEYHAHDFVHTHAHAHGRQLDAQEMAYNAHV